MRNVLAYLSYALLVSAFVVGIQIPTILFVTAAHDEFGYDLPHEVANQIKEYNISAIPQTLDTYSREGCNTVAIFAVANPPERTLVGWQIMASNDDGSWRLLSIELYNWGKRNVYSWVNAADFFALKACYERPEGEISI